MHIQQFLEYDLFDYNDCERIVDISNSFQMLGGSVLSNGKSVGRNFARNSDVKWFAPTLDTKWIFEAINNTVREINIRSFRFLLDGEMEHLQYLEYGIGQYYGHHTDSSDDLVATRKLTAVVQLSDPKDYIGGSLKIEGLSPTCRGKGFNRASKTRGKLILFPSHLNHVAMPVWWGRRKSIVCWFHGIEPLR